jgi:zinc D-Ala-D-Ala carboxypeptidase
MNWRNFSPKGDPALFACSCCEHQGIDFSFVDRLQNLRDIFGKPIRITSGYRCAVKDRAVGGSGPHQTGRAADIAIARQDVYDFVRLAMSEGFTGIGIKAHGSKRFVHLDDLKSGDWANKRPWIWTYS